MTDVPMSGRPQLATRPTRRLRVQSSLDSPWKAWASTKRIERASEAELATLLADHSSSLRKQPRILAAMGRRAVVLAKAQRCTWSELLDQLDSEPWITHSSALESVLGDCGESLFTWIEAAEPRELCALLVRFRSPRFQEAVLTRGRFDIDAVRNILRRDLSVGVLLSRNPYLERGACDHIAYLAYDAYLMGQSDDASTPVATRTRLEKQGRETLTALQANGYSLPPRLLEDMVLRARQCPTDRVNHILQTLICFPKLPPQLLRALYLRHGRACEMVLKILENPDVPEDLVHDMVCQHADVRIASHPQLRLRHLRTMARVHHTDALQQYLARREDTRKDPEIRAVLIESRSAVVLGALGRDADAKEFDTIFERLLDLSPEAALALAEETDRPLPATKLLPLLLSSREDVRTRAMLVLAQENIYQDESAPV